MASLLSLGVRNVPVLARGTDYVFGQQIADVARFVGVQAETQSTLAPDVLMTRWIAVLRSAQRLCLQLSAQALARPAIEVRPGTLGELAWHVFGIGEGFIECVEGREPDWVAVSMRVPPGGVIDTPSICNYGDQVIAGLDHWWNEATPSRRDGSATVHTFQGEVTLHQFLERQTWHSAQHVRQIADVIEQNAQVPDWPGRDRELAGLPLPAAVWG